MAKDKIEIDVEVNDNGSTKKAAVAAKGLGDSLDKTAKSSRTAQKNIKGVAGTASAGGKNFSKMAQGITSGIVPAYAVLAANIFAVTAAFGFLKRAADLSELKKSQLEFAAATGQGMAQITASLKEASNGMLGFREAAQAAAIGSAKGFSPEMMEKLAIGATKASKALGRDFADSFDRLVRGVSKAEPELLDELGITLRLETASKNYAKQLGLVKDELTASQRSMAVYLEVQKQLDDQYGSIDGAENPYQKLAKTFEELIDKITQGLLPVFNTFANIIADNAGIALVFFTSIGLSILKTFPIFDGAAQKFNSWADETEAGLMNMEHDYDSYIDKIEATEAALKDLERAEDSNQSAAKGSASSIVNDTDAPGGPIKGRGGLALLQSGGNPSKRQLGAMLKSAKNNTGEYKKLSEKKRKQFIKDIEKMMKKENKLVRNSKKGFRGATRFIKKSITGAARVWKKSMMGMEMAAARMAQRTGRAMKKMGKVANSVARKLPFIGIFLTIQQGFSSLLDMPFDALMGIVDFGMRAAQTLMNMIDGLTKGFKSLLNLIPGVKLDATVGIPEEYKITEEMIEKAKENAAASSVGQAALGQQQQNLRADAVSNALEDIQDRTKDLRRDLRATSKAYANLMKGKDENGKDIPVDQLAKNALKAARIKAKALSTSNVRGLLDEGMSAVSLATEGLQEGDADYKDAAKTANKKFLAGLKSQLDKDGGKFQALYGDLYSKMFDGDISDRTVAQVQTMFKTAQEESSAWLSNIKDSRDSITAIVDGLAGKDLYQARDMLKQLENTQRVFEEQLAKDPTHTNPHLAELEAMFGMKDGKLQLETYRASLEKLIAERASIIQGKSAATVQGMEAGRNLSGSSLKDAQEQNALDVAKLNLRQAILDISIAQKTLDGTALTNDNQAEIDKLTDAVAAAKAQKEVMSAGVLDASAKMDDVKQMGLKIGASFESSMVGAFDAIITGAKDAKTAFADMARGMLGMIAKLIAELLVASLLRKTLGGSAFGSFLGIGGAKDGGVLSPPSRRYGGITKNRYGGGGIASGRDAGYPAILHGTEAVVPLPNNRSIPVDLGGQAGQNNMVTVNISMDGQGGANQQTSSNGEQGKRLGTMIAAAVQEELQNQKRSGGILNPYGVA